ncbi:hypothetical protein CUA56_26450, partial [Shigella boydii]
HRALSEHKTLSVSWSHYRILRISPRDPILKIQTQAVDSNSIPLDYSLLYSNIFEFQVKYFFPR